VLPVAPHSDMDVRNAYFTFDDCDPIIRISMPMLKDSASDDELGFILGHEYGHLVSDVIAYRSI